MLRVHQRLGDSWQGQAHQAQDLWQHHPYGAKQWLKKDADYSRKTPSPRHSSARPEAERIVSRPQHEAEEHRSLSAEEFEAARNRGEFSLTWFAHGLHYGIPSQIEKDIKDNRVVIMNVSRTMISNIRERFRNVAVLLIDAPLRLRSRRLATRGRESPTEIEMRLSRQVSGNEATRADIVIENTGTLEQGTARFLSLLKAFNKRQLPSAASKPTP